MNDRGFICADDRSHPASLLSHLLNIPTMTCRPREIAIL